MKSQIGWIRHVRARAWRPSGTLRVLGWWLSAALTCASVPVHAVEVGDTVTLPSLTLLDGKTLPASAFKDRTVIVEYWASWCPFCAQQNPHVQKLFEATRGKPIQIVTLSIDKKPQEAIDYLKAHGYTFPAGMETDAWQAALGKRRGLPELYVIGRNGKVLRKEVGEMFGEDVAALADYAGK
ncbi:TlpA family protein disulfide reductase [Pandoraea sp. NPDC087047]|uniref:TlpA family protein disulfide reductase n=1 Tax=Pandoraea sp. NPDC087047 TaxID=3364390 RepID=UPI003820FF5A